jgi:arylsulfatase
MIANIDDNMAILMEKLEAWGLEENTLLIFMTDNGQASRMGRRNGKRYPLFAAGLKNGKGSPNEGGTRVPAFWRWKGLLEEGADINTLAAHVDLFDTFAELAGAKIPPGTQPRDGRSLLPLLDRTTAQWDDRFLFTHVGRWGKGSDPDQAKFKSCAVRSEQYRLVNNRELYDINADPGETTNIIDQHPDVVKTMRAAYDKWWNETRPLMVNEAVPNSPTKPFWVLYEKQQSTAGIPDWVPPKF